MTIPNEPPELVVDEEMRQAMRAGMPLKMADPEDDLRDVPATFPHYIGQRQQALGGCYVVKAEADGTRAQLSPRFDLARHSPDGFQWGYEGSGPAQLALAILADFLEDDRAALELYQEFKRRVVARITTDRWRLTAPMIRAAVEEIREHA